MARILIVDDEESITSLLKQILENEGYACVLAADVTEARRCLEEYDCDLAFCDINMPGESGLALVREISQRYRDTLYDPEVVDVCLKLFVKKEFRFESPLI